MGLPGKKTVEDHWRYQRDDLNVFARRVAPILVKTLLFNSEIRANVRSVVLSG